MSKPSLRLQLTKLVFYHILVWQLGRWPQSKFHFRAYADPLPLDEVSTLRVITRDLEFKQQPSSTEISCDGTSFYGLTISCNCNFNNQCRISKIEISNLDLTGTIHEGVGYLIYLQKLTLSGNKLHGSIPATLGNLKNLETLDLSKNQLSGQIPASLGGLDSLQYLYLQYNLLSGGIPRSFGSLGKLNVLNLGFNMLSGSIPEDFGSLSLLTNMDLSDNQLSGPLPESLGKLKSLRVFDVSGNYLSEKFPNTSYGNLTSLQYFSITGNYISGPLPVEAMAKWTSLYYLSLMGNYFEGRVTKEIFNLQKLQYLRVSDLATNSFQLPERIANSANFVSLRLRNCSITGSIPKYVSEEMTSLSYLDLSFNKLTGGLPHYMKSDMDYMSFSGNKLSGTIPHWIFRAFQTRMDLSFNNFSAVDSAVPNNLQLNLFACCPNSSTSSPDMMDPFKMKNTYCPRNKPKYHSLFINCGGEETTVLGNVYDQDNDTSLFYTSPKKNWAYSLSGDIGVQKSNTSDFIKSTIRGVSITEAPLYEKARLSPVSLKYYAFCLRKGTYTVTLHFHEIIYIDDADYTSLRKRAFDVYIQGNMTLNDFNIRDKEGSGEKPITVNHSAEVEHDGDLLEIHLYWRGKGSYEYWPNFNGPLISAISVNPEFDISPDKYKRLRIALITIASFIAALLLLLAFGWWMGWLSIKEEPKIKIGHEEFTVKEVIKATENFGEAKKIGGSRTIFMAELGVHTVAVKRLDSGHFKEKIDQLKREIHIIQSLQHNNILRLLAFHIEKDLQFLVYEYMEKHSVADILFDPSSRVKLDWEKRLKICLGIAQGLKYLHDLKRVKIAHTNIKSTNILLNKNFEAKISDFGFARLYTEEDKVRVIARETKNGYTAPECLQREDLTDTVDVFSFGVVVLEIVSGERNVASSSKKEVDILLERAYQANKNENLKSLVNLQSYDERKALIILKLALDCTALGTTVRPTMSEVVSVLLPLSIDEACPPAEPTGDVSVASSTTSGKSTSVASTSSNST